MSLLLIDELYCANVAKTMLSMSKQQFMRLAVDHINDKDPKYGRNILYSNISELVCEDIYDGPLKIFANDKRGLELYDGVLCLSERGGSLVESSHKRTLKLCAQILRMGDEIRTSFVCTYVYVVHWRYLFMFCVYIVC